LALIDLRGADPASELAHLEPDLPLLAVASEPGPALRALRGRLSMVLTGAERPSGYQVALAVCAALGRRGALAGSLGARGAASPPPGRPGSAPGPAPWESGGDADVDASAPSAASAGRRSPASPGAQEPGSARAAELVLQPTHGALVHGIDPSTIPGGEQVDDEALMKRNELGGGI